MEYKENSSPIVRPEDNIIGSILEIIDMEGSLVRKIIIHQQESLNRNLKLCEGIYFYRCVSSSGCIRCGRLIVWPT